MWTLGFERLVRWEVSGGLFQATQFWKVGEKKHYLRNPPACWSNVVCIDTTALCAARASNWRRGYNYIAPLHLASFNIDKQNPLSMFCWFHLPNISWENINLMGANTYPVIPVEVTQRQEELYMLYLLCVIKWPLNSGMEPVVSFFFFLPFFLFLSMTYFKSIIFCMQASVTYISPYFWLLLSDIGELRISYWDN